MTGGQIAATDLQGGTRIGFKDANSSHWSAFPIGEIPLNPWLALLLLIQG